MAHGGEGGDGDRDERVLAEIGMAARFRRALLRFNAQTDAAAAANGLTARQYVLLLAIKAAPEERLTIGEIQAELSLRQSAASELVDRAVRKGLVERRPGSSDGRLRCVGLTEEGERRLMAAFASLRRRRRELADAFRRADELLHELAETQHPPTGP